MVSVLYGGHDEGRGGEDAGFQTEADPADLSPITAALEVTQSCSELGEHEEYNLLFSKPNVQKPFAKFGKIPLLPPLPLWLFQSGTEFLDWCLESGSSSQSQWMLHSLEKLLELPGAPSSLCTSSVTAHSFCKVARTRRREHCPDTGDFSHSHDSLKLKLTWSILPSWRF